VAFLGLAALAILSIAALAVAAVGGLLIWAGGYQLLKGRKVPGRLGNTHLLDSDAGRVSEGWSETRWRRNGFQVVGVGLALVFASGWLTATAWTTFR
jgi:hypothetical protein